MHVLILHNAIASSAGLEDQDTLLQRDAIRDVLVQAGHQVEAREVALDLVELHRELKEHSPDVVFNLVESLAGTDRLISLVPMVLDACQVPFTGSPATAIYLSSDKVLSKERLRVAGLPTPDWWEYPAARQSLAAGTAPTARRRRGAAQIGPSPSRAIIKSIDEHGSVGLDASSLVTFTDDATLREALERKNEESRHRYFAERFVDGREINVSILEGDEGPRVLPPAEIEFIDYPPGKPRIVCYDAKWVEGSFAYQNTPRRFDFSIEDQPLLEQLCQLARQCWSLFGLKGYARVDFRVDELGQPWILEINANPCLTPEGGFWAALQHAGIEYAEALESILDVAATGAGLRVK